MATFIMLTCISHEKLDSPASLEKLELEVMEQIRKDCPEVDWVQNFAILGPYDYMDVFRAPDVESATKVATLIRTFGHAKVEIWPATEWAQYKDLLHKLPRVV